MTDRINTISFLTLDNEGKVIETRVLNRSDIGKCPSFIFLASHYREDGTCRHDEPTCEEEGCPNLKFDDEIFCTEHLEVYGV